MDSTLRPVTPEEFPAFLRALETAFGQMISDEEIEEARATFELDRSLACFEGGSIVATAGAYSFQLTVPGPATVPAAGVTTVSVLPTHRRRGLMRALMERQLDDIHARGEPVAILLASESIIYGRFGYGLATNYLSLEIDRQHTAFARPLDAPGQLVLLDRDEAAWVLPEVYERVRLLQPGQLSRTPAWWEHYLRDPERNRDGMSGRFYVAYRNASGHVDGYASYRVKSDWSSGFPNNTLVLLELITTSAEARAALWQYCLSVDLIRSVRAPNCPVDEPLRWMLADPRRLRVTHFGDWLWARILDIPAALSSRRYSAQDRLVLEVADAFRPQGGGRFELVGGPDGAECRRSEAPPDLSLEVADLGAAYLGGVGFCTLARAGRVTEHTPRALRRADALFTWDPAPHCTMHF